MVGRKQKLSPEQQRELVRRYKLFLANRPMRLEAEFGITRNTLLAYVYGKHKARLANG